MQIRGHRQAHSQEWPCHENPRRARCIVPLQRGTEKARPQIGRSCGKLETRRGKLERGGGGSEEEERKGGQARMPVPLEGSFIQRPRATRISRRPAAVFRPTDRERDTGIPIRCSK